MDSKMSLLFLRDIEGYVSNGLGCIHYALAMTLMIITTTYTAILTTRNIENTFMLPVQEMSDPNLTYPTSKFKVATYNYGFFSNMFKQSANSTWKCLGEFMEP